MAITISTSTPFIEPVYSPFYYVCTSTNVTQPNFKYVFDIYTGSTTAGTYVFRSKILPRPVSNNAIFNPNRVLESYLSYNNNTWQNTNGTIATNHYMQYTVSIGEEYVYYWPFDDNFFPSAYPSLSAYTGYIGFTSNTFVQNYYQAGDSVIIAQNPTGNTNTQYNGVHTVLTAFSNSIIIDVLEGAATGAEAGTVNYADLRPTILSGLTNSGPKNAFNGVQQYTQIPTWNYANFIMSSSTGQFLTNMPRSGVYIRDNEHACLNFLNTGNTSIRVLLKTFQNSGGTISSSINFLYTPDQNNEISIGTGIFNLNNRGSGTLVNVDTDYKYEIALISAGTVYVSEIITYLVDNRCSKYENIRFMFLNRLGGWDFFDAYLVSRKTVDINKNTYKKILDYNYTVGDRGYTVYDSTIQESYMVTSDWVNQDTSDWLEELFTSPEVYWLKDDGGVINNDPTITNATLIPIIITTKNQEIKKIVNDAIVNYTIEFQLAYPTDVQRNS